MPSSLSQLSFQITKTYQFLTEQVTLYALGLKPKYTVANLPTEVNFGKIFTAAINWFLGLVGLIAVLMLIIGGFRILMSGGNQESVTKGKNTILYAIVGIIVIIFSYAIVHTITSKLANPGGVSG